MSVSPSRVCFFRPLVISTAILVSGACHQAKSPPPEPSVGEPAGQTTQSTDERRVRRFPGVDIVPLNRSAFVVRIHSGMVGDGEPLYVIDGAPIRILPTRGIDWFQPEDIAEIKVLKLPHEVAEYGPNGVNGVIVITTKQAPRRPQRR